MNVFQTPVSFTEELISPQKKRRITNPLEMTANQKRYAKITSKQCLLTSPKKNPFIISWLERLRYHIHRVRRMKTTIDRYWNKFSEHDLQSFETVVFDQIPENLHDYVVVNDQDMHDLAVDFHVDVQNEDDENDSDNDITSVDRRAMTRSEALDRRHALKYCYSYLYGSPPEEVWAEMDLINALCATLEIPYNSRTRVKKFLQNVCRNPSYNIKKNIVRNLIIKEGSEEAKIICHNMEHDISVSMTTFMLNTWLRSVQKPTVSWSAVENFKLKGTDILVTRKRGTKKSGKLDPNLPWSRARLAAFRQFKMFRNLRWSWTR